MAQEINIKNGNSGAIAQVDTNERLHVAALTADQAHIAHGEGDGYNWNTGIISLTGNATTSALLYVKNLSEIAPLVIELQLIHVGATTGGAGNWYVKSYKNIDDASTIVSGAVLPEINGINYDAGSQDTPSDIISYKGVEGSTVVGGVKNLLSIKTVGAWGDAVPIVLFLNAGENLCVTLTTPVGNTAMEAMAVFSGHHLTEKESV